MAAITVFPQPLFVGLYAELSKFQTFIHFSDGCARPAFDKPPVLIFDHQHHGDLAKRTIAATYTL
ncbi:hypothetical protein QCA50_011819 [Cerrena zonata]|uniref:Uncharacterized protein n=1 Tax=Cerrena zonata TaxID=2478898 RepID=A0AAW0G3L1_9APHY